MILFFWMFSFKPTFSLSTFTSIKRLFRSSSLSAIRVVSSAYLRLLLLLPEIWEQWPHKRLTQTCLWVCRSLWWRRGLAVACCRVGGTACGSVCPGTFEEGRHYLHYLHHSLASGQTIAPHQQKIGLKIDWAWPHSSEQDPVSPSVSLSHKLMEASISLLSLSFRGQTEWKPQSQKTNQTDHMKHSLV